MPSHRINEEFPDNKSNNSSSISISESITEMEENIEKYRSNRVSTGSACKINTPSEKSIKKIKSILQPGDLDQEMHRLTVERTGKRSKSASSNLNSNRGSKTSASQHDLEPDEVSDKKSRRSTISTVWNRISGLTSHDGDSRFSRPTLTMKFRNPIFRRASVLISQSSNILGSKADEFKTSLTHQSPNFSNSFQPKQSLMSFARNLPTVRNSKKSQTNAESNIFAEEQRRKKRARERKVRLVLLRQIMLLALSPVILILPGYFVGVTAYDGYLFGGLTLFAESFYWLTPIVNPFLYIYMNEKIKQQHLTFMRNNFKKWQDRYKFRK